MSAAGKRAYFTLVQNEPWVIGALVLGHSLHKSKTAATLVCQTGPEVSDESRERLAEVYDVIEPAQEYQFPESSFNKFADIPERLAFSFRRLNAWRRTEFERITYLDSVVVVLKNIDALFDIPGVAAPREFDFRVWKRGETYTDFFNGGLVTFTPSRALFERFAETLATQWVYLGASEQHLVNVVCCGDWFRIPDRYHVQVGARQHAHFSECPARVRTLHFSKISKPWDERYRGRKSLWPSWYRFSRMWMEWLRDYEAEYSHRISPRVFWWESADAVDGALAGADGRTTADRNRAAHTRARRIRQTPTKLAEIAVFKGAFQKISELGRLIALLRRRKLRTVVEIGTLRGGTLWLWCQLATENARIVSIDLPAKSAAGRRQQGNLKKHAIASQRLDFIRNDSQKEVTRAQLLRLLDGDAIDFLFIDGDHRYEAVRRDFQLYSPLLRPGGIVAFHDILQPPRFPDNQVELFWGELKKDYRTKELVDPADERGWGQWGGIGVVYIR